MINIIRIVTGITGIIFIISAGVKYFQDQSVLQWRLTSGEVTYLDIVVVGGRIKFAQKLQPQIRYKYIVDGRQYIGNKIFFNEKGAWRDDQIVEELRGYTKGSTIDVYYNPENPQNSVLKRKITYEEIKLFAAIGIFCILLAILLKKIIEIALGLILSITSLQSKRLK